MKSKKTHLVFLAVAAPRAVEGLKNLTGQNNKRSTKKVAQDAKNADIVPVAQEIVRAENKAEDGIKAKKPEETAVGPLRVVVDTLPPGLVGGLIPAGESEFHETIIHAQSLEDEADVDSAVGEHVVLDGRQDERLRLVDGVSGPILQRLVAAPHLGLDGSDAVQNIPIDRHDVGKLHDPRHREQDGSNKQKNAVSVANEVGVANAKRGALRDVEIRT